MRREAYIGDDADSLVFGTRTILVPGRKVEIGFSVRKKSAFPIVQELLLKLLRTIGGSSIELLVTFFDFSEKEIREALRPLIDKGFVIREHEEFCWSDVGSSLFSSSHDGVPAISESESLERPFRVDDYCGLPVEADDLGRYLQRGSLKWFIDEYSVDQVDAQSPNEMVMRSFNEYFPHFIRNEEDLEKIRAEKMFLHKTEYCVTKENIIVRADVRGEFSKIGLVANRVAPFDDISPKSDQRQTLRDQLVKQAQIKVPEGSSGEVEFFRKFFGDDFLEGSMIKGMLAWYKIIPPFFKEDWPSLKSGTRLAIGDAALPRNTSLIGELIQDVLSEREVTTDSPLRIVWIRPAVSSWGRSIGFLEALEHLREIINREALKGAVTIELWEKSGGITKPQQRSYEKWFDSLKRFSSKEIPDKVEMLLVGDTGGLALTHAFTPPQSGFPCPIGVFFRDHPAIQELMKSEVHGGLRSLPKLAKKKKKKAKGG
jgi:hypothetical protein